MENENEFFEGKRPWSKIKDKVLGKYLAPYLIKVKGLRKDIILVDCFAGPGKFEDGEIGSPLIICQIAEKNVPGKFKAFLVNKSQIHHNKLELLLAKFIEKKSAFPMYSDAKSLLGVLKEIIGEQTLFIYLDPFGLKAFDFSTLLPFLNRTQEYSTEVLINVSVPIIHRLSGKNTIKQNGGIIDSSTQSRHDRITAALGGEYWKEFIFNDQLSPQQQIVGLINKYTENLKKYLPYVGSCIVYESTEGSTIKYFIVFASRHIDSPILLNDIMFDSYQEHIWKAESKGTLFEDQDYETALPKKYFDELKGIVLNSVKKEDITRLNLWKQIVISHFMRYKSKDYRNAVKELIKDRKVKFVDIKGTGKLNDDSLLTCK